MNKLFNLIQIQLHFESHIEVSPSVSSRRYTQEASED